MPSRKPHLTLEFEQLLLPHVLFHLRLLLCLVGVVRHPARLHRLLRFGRVHVDQSVSVGGRISANQSRTAHPMDRRRQCESHTE